MIDLNKNQLNFRKTIVDTVIEAENKFITENPEQFNDYKDRNIEKYNEYVEHKTENSFFLESLNATLLFFAEKDGRYLMGQIGDGVIGVILDDKTKNRFRRKKEIGKKMRPFIPIFCMILLRMMKIGICMLLFKLENRSMQTLMELY